MRKVKTEQREIINEKGMGEVTTIEKETVNIRNTALKTRKHIKQPKGGAFALLRREEETM